MYWFVLQNDGPTLVEARGQCAYSIRWETPVACPRNSTVSGVSGSCSVTDPATGVLYDLHALTRAHSYYTVNSTSGRSFKVLMIAAILNQVEAQFCVIL